MNNITDKYIYIHTHITDVILLCVYTYINICKVKNEQTYIPFSQFLGEILLEMVLFSISFIYREVLN